MRSSKGGGRTESSPKLWATGFPGAILIVIIIVLILSSDEAIATGCLCSVHGSDLRA